MDIDNGEELGHRPITGDESLDEIIQRRWGAIATRRRSMRIIDTVNVCLITRDGGEASVGHEECRVWFHLQTVWRELTTRAKINCW